MKITLVRHGQSIANIGEPFDDHTLIPLTDLGHEQAKKLAASWTRRPDRIFLSPFLRTHLTAAPTIARFPTVPVSILPVEEFTYLTPSLWKGSTWAQRRPDVEAYWKAMDPDFVHGPEAESFTMLLGRVRKMFMEIEALALPWCVVFTHAQFMEAVRLVIEPDLKLPEIMHRLCHARLADNTACYNLEHVDQRWCVVPETPQASPIFCNHANEMPYECPCGSDCYCKAHSCRMR